MVELDRVQTFHSLKQTVTLNLAQDVEAPTKTQKLSAIFKLNPKDTQRETSAKRNRNKRNGSTAGETDARHVKNLFRRRKSVKANIARDHSPPMVQPISIVNVNPIHPVVRTEVNARAHGKSGSDIRRGTKRFSILLKDRKTSRAVATLTEILRASAPADCQENSNDKGEPLILRSGDHSATSSAAARKSFKDVTDRLTKPEQASRIIAILKTQPHPSLNATTASSHINVQGVCLVTTDDRTGSQSLLTHQADTSRNEASGAMMSRLNPSNGILNLVTGMSLGTIVGVMARTSGLFDALATCTGEIIQRSEAHQNLIGLVPTDRVSLWKYWWGFEIALPPPSIANLEKTKSISATFLQLLMGLTVAGGIVELTPFIQYLSSYLDMEWKAIVSQNKGRGVVLAATWALPVAIVPRTWDFDQVLPTDPSHSGQT